MSSSRTETIVVISCEQLRAQLVAVRTQGKSIAIVPTMGALHEGHLSLIRAAKAQSDFTVVTIFVNPTQFGPHEDFGRYPRTLEADLNLLDREGVDLVFAPNQDEMYPSGYQTYVDVPKLSATFEGEIRPGHFRGVATIVLKLLNLVQPQVAIFGQKDFQQAAIIERMVRDLDVPVRVSVHPTVRETDGLAMSSRNRYLSAEDRRRALGLSRALRTAQGMLANGERSAAVINKAMTTELAQSGVDAIDYAIVCDVNSLEPIERVGDRAVALIAARVGATRLIDNEILRTD